MIGISNDDKEMKSVPEESTKDKFHQQKTSKSCAKNPVWWHWWVISATILFVSGLSPCVVAVNVGLDNTFDLTIVDLAKPDLETRYSIELDSNSNLHTVLEEYQKASKGKFKYPKLSATDHTKTSTGQWVLGKRTSGTCIKPVDLFSYIPVPGDDIILAHITKVTGDYFSCSEKDRPRVQISVWSLVPDVLFTNASYYSSFESNTKLIDILETLQKENTKFRFTTTEYAGLGEFITSINGLKQDESLQHYWSLTKVVDGKSCVLSVGVSSYRPDPGEHIVLAYIPLDMFRKIPSCDGGCGHDCISIQISVDNFVHKIPFVNSSYTAKGETNETLINFLKQLNESGSDFRFTTVEYPKYGEMITSVNGLKQTKKTYWGLLKVVEGTMCLLPVGASSYVPKAGEEIFLVYMTLKMFKNFSYCDTQNAHDSRATVQIGVQNLVRDIAFVNSSYMAKMEKDATLIDIMEDLRDSKSDFRFTTLDYSAHGKFITSINGLKQNKTLQHYWSVTKVVDGKSCLLSVGVSSYRPDPDDRIVFAYIPLGMFSKIPSCDGGCGHDCISIEISVDNFVHKIPFVNSSYTAKGETNETLINFLKQLNESGSDFRFTTVEYSGLGEMITSVNGLKQTKKMYWGLLKMVEETMCLLPVGASSYHPKAGEEIVLAYMTLKMFKDFSYCDSQTAHASRAVSQIGVQNLVGDIA